MFLLFLLHSMGIALFRLTGAICRDETIASTGGVRAPWQGFYALFVASYPVVEGRGRAPM